MWWVTSRIWIPGINNNGIGSVVLYGWTLRWPFFFFKVLRTHTWFLSLNPTISNFLHGTVHSCLAIVSILQQHQHNLWLPCLVDCAILLDYIHKTWDSYVHYCVWVVFSLLAVSVRGAEHVWNLTILAFMQHFLGLWHEVPWSPHYGVFLSSKDKFGHVVTANAWLICGCCLLSSREKVKCQQFCFQSNIVWYQSLARGP